MEYRPGGRKSTGKLVNRGYVFCRFASSQTPLRFVTTHDLDDLFHQLATAQSGVASLRQARALGFTDDQIRHRRRGRWPTPWTGVVQLPGTPDTWETQLLAGCLRASDHWFVSHGSAAKLLGLDGFDDPSVEFVARRPLNGRRSGLIVHETRCLDAVDAVTVRRSIPPSVRKAPMLRRAGVITAYRTTSASRTIIDLAARLDLEQLGRAIDSACRLGHSSPAYLVRRLGELRGPGRAGTRRLDQAIVDIGGHSMLERGFLRLLRINGLPRPDCQIAWAIPGRLYARVDFDFQPLPLVIEVGGNRGHSGDVDRARDARRRNELQSLGVEVLEFTFGQVMREEAYVVETVRRTLSRLALPVDLRHR